MADGGDRLRPEFEDSAVGRRMAWCGELSSLRRDAKGAANVAMRAKTRQRAHALLRLLLPGEVGGDRATDALYSASSAKRLFADRIEAARQQGDAEKLRVALLHNDLRGMVNHVLADTAGHGSSGEWPRIPDDFVKIDPNSPYAADSPAMPVLNEARTLGALPEGLAASAAQVIAQTQFLRFSKEHYARIDPELATALAEIERAAEDYTTDVLSPARVVLRGLEAEAYRTALDRYNTLRVEYDTRFSTPAHAIGEKLVAAYKTDRQRKIDAIRATVADYLASVMAESDVSEERATEWANRQVSITPTAARRLKKQGYAPAQVVKDAAEFYRLCRGRIEKVVIDSRGDRRANANSIDSHGAAGVINLGSAFDKRVLWHELGHHVEADPVAAMAARLFIRLRSDDDKPHSLRKLTGSTFYGTHEQAFRNGFFSPYVGKVYRDGKTEVFSMGLESFSDAYLLATRIAVDPETFEFVIGYLRSPKTALHGLHLAMRQSMREGNESATVEALDAARDKIRREAAKIAGFVETAQFPDGLDASCIQMLTRLGGRLVGYLPPNGSSGHCLMALGKGRHPLTGRRVGVYWFFRIDLQRGAMEWASTHIPAGEPEIARIFLWYWRQHDIEPNYRDLMSGAITVSEE